MALLQFFLIFGLIVLSSGCKQKVSLDELTADNIDELALVKSEEMEDGTYPIWVAYNFKPLKYISPNPKDYLNTINTIGLSWDKNPQDLMFTLKGASAKLVTVLDKKTGDLYTWEYGENPNKVEKFRIDYNHGDDSFDRFDNHLKNILKDQTFSLGVSYKETKLKNGLDAIIIPMNDVYVIGRVEIYTNDYEIIKRVSYVDFKVYHNYKK